MKMKLFETSFSWITIPLPSCSWTQCDACMYRNFTVGIENWGPWAECAHNVPPKDPGSSLIADLCAITLTPTTDLSMVFSPTDSGNGLQDTFQHGELEANLQELACNLCIIPPKMWSSLFILFPLFLESFITVPGLEEGSNFFEWIK